MTVDGRLRELSCRQPAAGLVRSTDLRGTGPGSRNAVFPFRSHAFESHDLRSKAAYAVFGAHYGAISPQSTAILTAPFRLVAPSFASSR